MSNKLERHTRLGNQLDKTACSTSIKLHFPTCLITGQNSDLLELIPHILRKEGDKRMMQYSSAHWPFWPQAPFTHFCVWAQPTKPTLNLGLQRRFRPESQQSLQLGVGISRSTNPVKAMAAQLVLTFYREVRGVHYDWREYKRTQKSL